MSWRTVVIGSRAKLDFKMNYMIVRKDVEITKIYIDEIYMLMIESTAVSITGVLLNELAKAKVKVVFCDEKRNPASELVSFYGSHNSSKRCREQIGWGEDIQALVWTAIVRRKIENQKALLSRENKPEARLLGDYLDELTINDETQREGHAAKVYFNSLFGKAFTRDADCPTNAALNYGYSILLSALNREIVGAGYLTQIGLNHCNQFNPYNLASDLIEPLRGLVDRIVVERNMESFGREEKMLFITLLSSHVFIEGTDYVLSNAFGVYCRSVFAALRERDVSLIKFISYEF